MCSVREELLACAGFMMEKWKTVCHFSVREQELSVRETKRKWREQFVLEKGSSRARTWPEEKQGWRGNQKTI
jgi:hypothetical protein